MSDDLIVRKDMDFLLFDWLAIDRTVERETVESILDLSGKVAVEQFLTHYKAADAAEPYLDAEGVHICPQIGAALRTYAELGLFAAGFPEELGGMGLPYTLCAASFAYFAAANIATAAYPMLTVANARLIASFGSAEQLSYFALPQIEGRWFGTMCLSEPQAGSSLADVRTRAVVEGADELGARYRLTGNKMWISGGDQDVSENIVHLVLAKIAGEDGVLPEGTAGISLFLVPKFLPDGARNDVTVAGLNHKMGYRGTANCLLNLGEQNGAIGWLVGEPGQGLRQMFQMMNEARIAVGIGAAALGYRSYRLAARYARERAQGRPLGVRGGPPVAIIEHPDVKRMLLAQKCYAEGALALCLYCAALVDRAANESEAEVLLALLTPVAKTWPAEYGLAANDLAIQVHGGYGYTRDFDVEQLWRDNRLNPIHEGTTGIQAIDLLGRKILRDDGSGIAALERAIGRTAMLARTDVGLTAHADALTLAWQRIGDTIAILRREPGERAFDNATPFLWAMGHVVMAWLWLDQAVSAATLTVQGELSAGKRAACRYFYECELPKAETWLGFVASGSDVAAGVDPAVF